MLLFLDDSYERTEDRYLHILGGFAISEAGHRSLVADVQRIKAERFVQERNLTPEEREAVWQDRFIVGSDPREIELKASLLLSSSILKRRSSIALRIARELLEALRNAEAKVHFAVTTPKELASGLTTALLNALDSAQARHQEPLQLVLDGTNPNADRVLARRYTELILSPEGSRRYPTLSPTPFIVDTHTSPALQVADLVAHVLLHRNRPEATRKPLTQLDALVKTLEPSPSEPRDA